MRPDEESRFAALDWSAQASVAWRVARRHLQAFFLVVALLVWIWAGWRWALSTFLGPLVVMFLIDVVRSAAALHQLRRARPRAPEDRAP
jgi:hypothetical protein